MGIRTILRLGSVSLCGAAIVGLSAPAIAHKVEISGEVGGTIHIEPNDNPRAGEPSLTWFALTRSGGELIPLAACNCQLAIYAQPYQPGDTPVLEPALEAVSQEGYENIPGAEITFPQVGAYELVLQGEPIAVEDFQPFELRYDVTVATGQAAASPALNSAPNSDSEAVVEPDATSPPAPTDTPAPDPRTQSPLPLGLLWIFLISVGAIALLFLASRLRQSLK